MKKSVALGMLGLACLLASGVSSAHTRFYGGVYIGGPLWVAPPAYYYPPPVYIERQPAPVYVEPAPTYWYYCTQANGYYPYIQNCPAGWMKVVPGEPSQAPSQPPSPPPR